jgi:hypothetical protein
MEASTAAHTRRRLAPLAVCGTGLVPVVGAHLSSLDRTCKPDLLLQEQDAIDEHFRGRPTSQHIDAHRKDAMAAAHHSLQVIAKQLTAGDGARIAFASLSACDPCGRPLFSMFASYLQRAKSLLCSPRSQLR